MLIAERQQKILEILEQRGRATVEDLVGALYCSAPTIRRDLTAMAQNGLIKKVYGGALPLTAGNREIPLVLREQAQSSPKEQIAQQAAARVRDGMVIFMDAGSTVGRMVPYLEGIKDLLVITSGAKTALALAERNVNTLCTGGQLLNHSLSYVGHHAEEFIRRFNADIAFFSCHGLSEEGLLTEPAMEEAQIRQVMLSRAKRKILLCDRSKYGKTYFYTLCHRDEIDEIISE